MDLFRKLIFRDDCQKEVKSSLYCPIHFVLQNLNPNMSAVLSLLSFPPALVKAVYYVAGVFLNAALCVILVRYATKNGGEKSYFKGAVLCFFVWECVGLLFSLREKFFGTGSGLATAALLSLYLYFMMFGVVAGAGLNFYLADDVRKQ